MDVEWKRMPVFELKTSVSKIWSGWNGKTVPEEAVIELVLE